MIKMVFLATSAHVWSWGEVHVKEWSVGGSQEWSEIDHLSEEGRSGWVN